jgi:hypothetical protein
MTTWILRPVYRVVPVAFAMVCVAWPAVSAAQSSPTLVEIAKQEEARRKALKVPSKVFSDKDTAQTGQAPAAKPAGGAPDATAVPTTPAPVAPPPAAAESDGHDEAWWHQRMEKARADLRRNEAFAEALQSQVNALTTEFANRDDPAQRGKIGETRQNKLKELDAVKADIEKGKKLIADIEDDARRASVPAGWVR